MEPVSCKSLVVTAQFVRSVYELPKKQGREVVKALRRFLDDADDPLLDCRNSTGGASDTHSMRAGEDCRILYSDSEEVKLLFAGADIAARRFAERECVSATAFSESPIAFQLHIDFWQSEAVTAYESPSCGIRVGMDSLSRLILKGRKYLPLAHLLLSRGPEMNSIELSFVEIETTIGIALPRAARLRRDWWANDIQHAQANSWVAIGWGTKSPDLQNERVTFMRSAPA